MSILKRGAFAHNPNVEEVLENPSTGDGFSTIDDIFIKQLAACDSLSGQIDAAILELNKPVTVSANEVDELLTQAYAMADTGSVEQSILTPIFMSVIDGAMRSFKVSSKLGLTPSRVYNECESFSYSGSQIISTGTDSLTEYAYEKHEQKFRTESSSLQAKTLRDQNSMNRYKENHFKGGVSAQDEYSLENKIYVNNKEAFKKDGMIQEGREMHHESAETDHIIPCKVICDTLKGNKALTIKDIKEITNNNDNLAVTSHDINRAKSDCTNSDFIKKYANDLTDSEKQALLQSEKAATNALQDQQNSKVMLNLRNNRDIQKTFAKDAGKAALAQAGGEVILYILKPIYFEIKDSLRNGIEKGVSEVTFSQALKVRFGRVKDYIIENSLSKLTSSAFDFLKSFVSVLIEAIIGCLVGVFKMIWRLLKEGFKIIAGAVKILADKDKSIAEKGDAILQLAAMSISAVAGIYIDGAVKNLGIPEPWSMLLASVVAAVVAAGILYLLNRLDVFNTKKEMRRRRILEILDEMNEQVAIEAQEEMNTQPYNYATVI